MVLLRLASAAAALFLSAGAASAAGQSLAAIPAARDCATMVGAELSDIGGPGSAIASATEKRVSGIAVCSVEGMLAPSIGFRVDLPLTTWTQRYLQLGCGGLCGRIGMEVGAADGCAPLEAGGFVIASTDMGHQGMDASFGRDARKRADFAYRSVHLTALTAKRLISAFYGQAERYSYFNGCSDGGREALMEAQRYPDDFDGIVAGAPAAVFQVQNSMYHGWLARANTGADGQPILYASRLPLLHGAVLAACDGLDGHVDGLLTDPRLCRFDPAAIQCAAHDSDRSNCLAVGEVAVARSFYDGPRDGATGMPLVAGSVQRGSELAWSGVSVPMDGDTRIFSAMVALQALQNLIFEEPPPEDYRLDDLRFDLATFDLLKGRHALLDATDPDLAAFATRGGKLIQWHGWSDPHISPIVSIAYHEAVRTQMGEQAATDFTRLYMLPGVYHCGQGEGPPEIDLLSPIMDWVEADTAPDTIVARQSSKPPASFGQPTGQDDGAAPPAMTGPQRSRPVYPYPATARYSGAGDPTDAHSYVRGGALFTGPAPVWAGSGLLKPYAPKSE